MGNSGTGTLNVQAGGQVSNSTAYLGNNAGCIGTATVTGTGSKWTNSGTLYVGNYGSGTLNIGGGSDSGGLVMAKTLTLAYGSGVTGTCNINNGATLQAKTIQPGSGTAYFNWNDGVIQNYDVSTDLSILSGLVLKLAATGTHILNIDLNRTGTIGAVLADATTGGTLTKTGAGTLTLTGTNTFTDVTAVNNGTLVLSGGNGRLAATSSVVLGGTSTSGKLVLGNTSAASSQTLTGLTTAGLGGSVVGGYGTTASVLTLNIAGSSTFSGVLGGSTTAEKKLSLVKSGTGVLTLSGTNTYTGNTTVSAGVLSISSAAALPGYNVAGRYSLSSGAALVVGNGVTDAQIGQMLATGNFGTRTFGFDTSTGDRSYVPALSGAYGLMKASANTLILSGNNTYTGATTVSAGKLVVNSPGSLGNTPVGVSSGASLGGTGTIAGNVTVNSGGHIAPGNSLGTLTLTGNLSLASGALLDFELGPPGVCDQIAMPSSMLTLNSQQFSDFTFTPLAGFGPGSYTLIDAGTIQGSLGLTTTGTINGLDASLATAGNDLVLTVVPEPPTVMLLGVAALSILAYAARRRRLREVCRRYNSFVGRSL